MFQAIYRRVIGVLAKIRDAVATGFAILLIFLLAASLISGPIFTASKLMSVRADWIIIFGLVYLILWLISIAMMVDGLAFIYGIRHPILMPHYTGKLKLSLTHSHIKSGMGAVGACILSYAMMLYAFAVAYLALSIFQPCSFNKGPLNSVSAIYFSIVTAATVGFGDIYPISKFAMACVSAEIVFSFLYGIFIFSALAGKAANRGVNKSQ
jgi:hypothetical protein